MSSLSAACATSAPIHGDRSLFASCHPSLNPKPRFVFSKPSRILCVKCYPPLWPRLPLSSVPSKPSSQPSSPSPPEEQSDPNSWLGNSEFLLKSNAGAIGSLRALLYQKLDDGEDTEALTILNHLISAQPDETEWKFLAARLLNEMGEPAESRKLFEEILAVDPLSFEALFENAVLMDRCGEGEAVIERLERALDLARSEQKEKAARDVRLIMAQIQFLQKNVDAALASYEELTKEDPKDYRPYFCQGVIYSMLNRNKEAREKFAKYHELSPKKFEVNGYLQTPLSRVKLFGTEQSEL
ncbi:protein SLOW GREEN 1, chloroplastic [Dioscorea cayenensis subsp. rotundata]|uniref:Protein SLOW GREEN 1, chloroplastic n=1 Tax=Dioscorea cayennensis subsp. rotundata TaxID=55577 RepID=A0AB40B396_DIOCR|nr:protein SLOW GREEN 1, chloroplastic [Dioscorea cayenensis subsp. rotundata]